MPTKHTSSKILEARGAFRKDPQRLRQDAKGTGAFPSRAPSELTDSQKAAWHKLRKMAPPGLWTASDQTAAWIAACLWDEFLRSPATMPTSRVAQLRGLFASLGLDPVARTRLQPAEPVEEW